MYGSVLLLPLENAQAEATRTHIRQTGNSSADENYRFDSAKYRLCMNEKRYVAITRSDFAKLKEDMRLLDNVLKTVLQNHQTYFQERFVDGLSIRKYAEAHLLNCGSVDYLQKKLRTALVQLLKEWNEADGSVAYGPKQLDTLTSGRERLSNGRRSFSVNSMSARYMPTGHSYVP